MDLSFTVPDPFHKWLYTPKRYKIGLGGRGGGKSISVEMMSIILSFSFKDATILFARESQKSLEHSSMPSIKRCILENEMDCYFDMTNSYIRNRETNVNFLFIGLRECSIDSIKSISNVKRCIIEEAQSITSYSMAVLRPSIRANDSEIWAIFNPRYEDDELNKMVIGKELLEYTYKVDGKEYRYEEYEDDDYLITKVNYDGNCFFPDVLERERLLCLKENPNDYNHIWLGEIRKLSGRIFASNQLNYFDYAEYQEAHEKFYVKKAWIDPAFGKENCFTSCIIYSEIHGKRYILDAGLARTKDGETTDELLEAFLIQNNVKHVTVEANFHQKQLADKLARRFTVRKFYAKGNKLERIVNAQYSIRETCLFDRQGLQLPKVSDNKALCDTREGRNYTGLRQLFDFSDIASENNIKGNEFSYLDFPDALASLCLFSEIPKSGIEKDEKIGIDIFDTQGYTLDDEFSI